MVLARGDCPSAERLTGVGHLGHLLQGHLKVWGPFLENLGCNACQFLGSRPYSPIGQRYEANVVGYGDEIAQNLRMKIYGLFVLVGGKGDLFVV